MGHRPKAINELKGALANAINAQDLLEKALKKVEKNENKQLLQDTLANVKQAVDATRTSCYGFKD